MKSLKVIFTLIIAYLLAQFPAGAEICDTLAKMKSETYNISPRNLSEEERTEASKKMDEFWHYATANKESSFDCIKQLLLEEKEGSFFNMDGAQLLMSLDQSRETLGFVAECLVKPDLEDIDLYYYMNTAFYFAAHDVDIGMMARKLIEYDSLNIFVYKHAMTLDRYATTLMLTAVMPDEIRDNNIMLLVNSDIPEVKGCGIYALQLSLTEKSFFLLDSLVRSGSVEDNVLSKVQDFKKGALEKLKNIKAIDAKYSREELLGQMDLMDGYNRVLEESGGDYEKIREGIKKLLNDDNATYMDIIEKANPGYDFMVSAVKNLKLEDLPRLMNMKYNSMKSISDESMSEYMQSVNIVYLMVLNQGIYKDYLNNY